MDNFDLTSMDITDPVFGAALGKGVLMVHSSDKCEGRACCVHAPSDHHMVTWDMNWRADTRVMERICPHGVGHPDPDHMAYVTSVNPEMKWQGVHGCDGCCASGGS